tara:strand:+ start:422 stop:820 length:399 start_codon:yes stop_codon:yes gene_type:complete
MDASIEELRKLVKESLKEFNTNAAGGANQPIHAFSIPNQPASSATSTDVPPDPADIANAIVVAIKRLVNPVEDKEGNSALVIEVERSKRILEDWVDHEDALNDAAKIAAETLLTSLDVTGISHSKDAGTLAY